MFYFANWYFLFLLLAIPAIAWWYRRKGHRKEATFRFPSIQSIREISGSKQKWKVQTLFWTKLTAIALLILTLARPQSGSNTREFSTEGIDIILVLDISGSMGAIDFKPNRMEAAKSVAMNFIEGRKDDRIGLVVFAAESFLQCPLTIDYDVLKGLLKQVTIVEQKYDGTAIGMAIANAVNRLRDSQAKSHVMILLSDGRNNAGELDPSTAANMAKAFDIKIYTIGAGKRGQAPYPVQFPDGHTEYRMMDVEIDEGILNAIAQTTGGKYFRATDEKSLSTIYNEISKMEKTEVKVKEFTNYNDLYVWFLLPGLLLLFISAGLSQSIWRKMP